MHEPNGRRPVTPLAGRQGADRPRNRFGYFGQFTRYKGADVLLEAMGLLAAQREADQREAGSRRTRVRVEPDREQAPNLVLHGANLEHAPADFQVRFHELLAANASTVRLHGRYRPRDLPALMAEVDWVVVPSIWYENAPLVIQEAFAHGRPVLCSDIGGMAEAVTDGVDGLHFRAGSARALADAVTRAAGTPGLWDELAAQIGPVHRLDEHAATLQELYGRALAARRPPVYPVRGRPAKKVSHVGG